MAFKVDLINVAGDLAIMLSSQMVLRGGEQNKEEFMTVLMECRP